MPSPKKLSKGQASMLDAAHTASDWPSFHAKGYWLRNVGELPARRLIVYRYSRMQQHEHGFVYVAPAGAAPRCPHCDALLFPRSKRPLPPVSDEARERVHQALAEYGERKWPGTKWTSVPAEHTCAACGGRLEERYDAAEAEPDVDRRILEIELARAECRLDEDRERLSYLQSYMPVAAEFRKREIGRDIEQLARAITEAEAEIRRLGQAPGSGPA